MTAARRQLRIGSLPTGPLVLPPELVTATTVIYGGKGMGKSNLGSVIVEECSKNGLRWSLLDPMGVMWGLRYSLDGKGPGIQCLVLGGAHGDIPIEPTGGEVVADLVVDEDVNTLIDFSRKANGEMWSIGEKIRFVTDYALRLFRRQGELVGGHRREPLLQVLDEAARYIPQLIPSGRADLAKCVGAWEQIAEEGRNIGLGVAFLTQRSARMNKSVSELADVMFAFRTIGPNSLEAITDWLGSHVEKKRINEIAGKIRELEVGHALLVSPGWLKHEGIVRIRERETFDSSQTPKAGQTSRRVTGKAAVPDLGKYRDRMAETIERVKADDPKVLRKRIGELEDQLERAQSNIDEGAVRPQLVDQAEERGYAAGYSAAADVANERLAEAVRRFSQITRFYGPLSELLPLLAEAPVFESIKDGVLTIGHLKRPTSRSEERRLAVQTRPREPLAPARPARAQSETKAIVADGSTVLPPSAIKLLDAAAQLAAAGLTEFERSMLAAQANISTTSSTTEKAYGLLVSGGYLDVAGPGIVSLTELGKETAAPARRAPSLREYHDNWERLLARQPSAVNLLRAMLDAPMDSVTRTELADLAGISNTSSTTEKAFGTLVSLGLFEVVGKGVVGPGQLLYPKGLR